MRTTCEECGSTVSIRTIDADGVLIGDECINCGYYITRYMPGEAPE